MTSSERNQGTGVGAPLAAVLRSTGLELDGVQHGRARDAVQQAMQEAGSLTLADYAALVERDRNVYADLVDRLTVGETYFFREPAQIDLVRSIARTWVDRPLPRRVWSAGCATGEEPYTLAIVMEQLGLRDRCRIVGTDISEAALDRARAGVYGEWSLRRCGSALRAAYFEAEGDQRRLQQRLVDSVDLRLHTLMDGAPDGGAFDLVLCRNVLIYLRRHALSEVSATLRDALLPGGWLIVGSSDPLLRIDGLDVVRTDHGLAYRRASDLDRSPVATNGPSPERRPFVASESRTSGRQGCDQPAAATRGRAVPARSRPEPIPSAPEPQMTTSESGAEALATAVSSIADGGDVTAAEELLDAAIAEHPVDASLRVLAATLHLHAGRHDDAVADATGAIFLEPDLIVAHLLLGRAEELRGHAVAARRSFLTAHELLTTLPPDAEVPRTGGERAGALANTAATLAEATRE